MLQLSVRFSVLCCGDAGLRRASWRRLVTDHVCLPAFVARHKERICLHEYCSPAEQVRFHLYTHNWQLNLRVKRKKRWYGSECQFSPLTSNTFPPRWGEKKTLCLQSLDWKMLVKPKPGTHLSTRTHQHQTVTRSVYLVQLSANVCWASRTPRLEHHGAHRKHLQSRTWRSYSLWLKRKMTPPGPRAAHQERLAAG